jgi:hypothetical protein
MAKYKEILPIVEVEAEQFIASEGSVDVGNVSEDNRGKFGITYTATDQLRVNDGDWVVRYPDGQKLVLSWEAFEAQFEPSVHLEKLPGLPALPEHSEHIEELNSSDLETVTDHG